MVSQAFLTLIASKSPKSSVCAYYCYTGANSNVVWDSFALNTDGTFLNFKVKALWKILENLGDSYFEGIKQILLKGPVSQTSDVCRFIEFAQTYEPEIIKLREFISRNGLIVLPYTERNRVRQRMTNFEHQITDKLLKDAKKGSFNGGTGRNAAESYLNSSPKAPEASQELGTLGQILHEAMKKQVDK